MNVVAAFALDHQVLTPIGVNQRKDLGIRLRAVVRVALHNRESGNERALYSGEYERLWTRQQRYVRGWSWSVILKIEPRLQIVSYQKKRILGTLYPFL